MLSAGQPQLPATPAVNAASSMMPDMKTNGASVTSPLAHDSITKGPIQHIWVVTGPAGCGKSTVGQVLRKALGTPFLEGDDVSSSHCI